MAQCTNLISHCMDFRIQDTLDTWISEQGYGGDIDRVSVVGSCQSKELVLKHIKAGCELHGVKRVILTQHDDCGAYGGHGAFSSIESEREKLVADMMAVSKGVLENFPEVAVETLFVQQAGDSWKIVEV